MEFENNEMQEQKIYFSINPLRDSNKKISGYKLSYQSGKGSTQEKITLSPQQAQSFVGKLNIKEIPSEGMKTEAGETQFFQALNQAKSQQSRPKVNTQLRGQKPGFTFQIVKSKMKVPAFKNFKNFVEFIDIQKALIRLEEPFKTISKLTRENYKTVKFTEKEIKLIKEELSRKEISKEIIEEVGRVKSLNNLKTNSQTVQPNVTAFGDFENYESFLEIQKSLIEPKELFERINELDKENYESEKFTEEEIKLIKEELSSKKINKKIVDKIFNPTDPYILVTNQPIPGFELLELQDKSLNFYKFLTEKQYQQLIQEKAYQDLKVHESERVKRDDQFGFDQNDMDEVIFYENDTDEVLNEKLQPAQSELLKANAQTAQKIFYLVNGISELLKANAQTAQKIFYLVNGINEKNKSGETQKKLINVFNHQFGDELRSNDIPENVMPSHLENFGYGTFTNRSLPKKKEEPNNSVSQNNGNKDLKNMFGVPAIGGNYTSDVHSQTPKQILDNSENLNKAQDEIKRTNSNFIVSKNFNQKLKKESNQFEEKTTKINFEEKIETDSDDNLSNQSNSSLENRVKQLEQMSIKLQQQNEQLMAVNYKMATYLNSTHQTSVFKSLIESSKQERTHKEVLVQRETTQKAVQLTSGQKAATFFGGLVVGAVVGAVCGQLLGGLFGVGGGIPVVGIIVFFATLLIVGAIINRVMAAGFRNKNQTQAFMNQSEKSDEHHKILIADVDDAVRQAVQRAFQAEHTNNGDKHLLDGVIGAAKADFENWRAGNGNGVIYWGLRQWMYGERQVLNNLICEDPAEQFKEKALKFFEEILNQTPAMTPHQDMTHQQYKQLTKDPLKNDQGFDQKTLQDLQQGGYVELEQPQKRDDNFDDEKIENLNDEKTENSDDEGEIKNSFFDSFFRGNHENQNLNKANKENNGNRLF